MWNNGGSVVCLSVVGEQRVLHERASVQQASESRRVSASELADTKQRKSDAKVRQTSKTRTQHTTIKQYKRHRCIGMRLLHSPRYEWPQSSEDRTQITL